MSATIILQAGVRKMIAQKKYNRMKIEVSAHQHIEFCTTYILIIRNILN